MWDQIVTGLVGGLAISLSGLAKKESRENFDLKKMAPTVIIAGVVGAIAGWQGLDYGMAANGTLAIAVTVFVENAWKAFWRKIVKK